MERSWGEEEGERREVSFGEKNGKIGGKEKGGRKKGKEVKEPL